VTGDFGIVTGHSGRTWPTLVSGHRDRAFR